MVAQQSKGILFNSEEVRYMQFESNSEFVVQKLGLGSRLEFIRRWDVSGSLKTGLNTFCLRSSGSKFPSKLKPNSAKKKSVSSSK